MGSFPASSQSLSSDDTDANDLDDLDEQEIWEVDSTFYLDLGKAPASLPPRIAPSAGTIGVFRLGFPDIRKDGNPPWPAVAAKRLSSVSGLSPKLVASRRIPAVSRTIPRLMPQELGAREGKEEDDAKQMIAQSAPINIPDWSKVDKSGNHRGTGTREDDSEPDDNDEERLPPHEFLAREYARSQVTSFSLFEGAGRTLKGRDMSRVRDGVLTRTGFLE